jgi:hypothetical protein
VTTPNGVGRERLLLGKLADAKDQTLTPSRLVPAKPTKAHAEVGLGTKAAILAAVTDLVTAGFVSETNPGKRTAKYALTGEGAAHLASLEEPGNPNLLSFQRAFLLMQLLSAKGRTLTEGQANRLPKVAQEDLELTKPLANQLRRKLAGEGYVRSSKEGRSLHLAITDAGVAHLVSLRHHTEASFTVSGAGLNALVDATRSAATAATTTTVRPSGDATAGTTVHHGGDRAGPATAQPPPDLAAAAYSAFRELARERFSRNGLVPIFEVRRELAKKYGPAAARHDALDVPILQLRKDKKIRLISISDTRSASAGELEESITNGYETLFYMEDADGHPGNR